MDCVIAQLAAAQAGTAALGWKQAGDEPGDECEAWHSPGVTSTTLLPCSAQPWLCLGLIQHLVKSLRGFFSNTLNFEPFSSWTVVSHEQCVACSGRRMLFNEGFSQNPTDGWVDFVGKMLNFHQAFETAPKPESGGSGCAVQWLFPAFILHTCSAWNRSLKSWGPTFHQHCQVHPWTVSLSDLKSPAWFNQINLE